MNREYAKQCVGNGWHGLVDEAFDLLEEHGGQVTQLKEKFGQIRIYTTAVPQEIDDKIYDIEHRSGTICETCGAPSKLRSRGGWLKSVCDACLEKPRV